MDAYRIIERGTSKSDVKKLTAAGHHSVKVIDGKKLAEIIEESINRETAFHKSKINELEKALESKNAQIKSLQDMLEEQRKCIGAASNVNMTQISSEIASIKKTLVEEIQRQIALSTVSKQGKTAVVDMESLLDGMFKLSANLETNTDTVKLGVKSPKT